MRQIDRTMQEFTTSLAPAEVLAQAKVFFARRMGIYAAFLERESPTHAVFRGQGGEEVIIGVLPSGTGTRVTGSTYLFDMQVARFFSTLPAAPSAEPQPPAPATAGAA
jgi:hypothetical protein